MKVNIQAPWEVNDYLNGVITEKIGKLFEVDDRILHADVFLKTGVNTGIEDKLIEVRLSIPGPEIFAQAAAETFEKAVASVAEKLRKQLIKKKEKLSNR
ncbi:MAG: putative sigma-54 modulation protein [Saprospiraceae bacterium]|jgi:putative sigma-54 modulation protein